MKIYRSIVLLCVLGSFGVVGCEKHSFEETKQLYHGHGSHSDSHDDESHSSGDHHGHVDSTKHDESEDPHTDKDHSAEKLKEKPKGESKEVGL